MKSKIIALVLAVAVVAGCHRSGSRKTVIAGHIAHTETFPNQTTITVRVADYGRGPVRYSGNIDKNGNFKITFSQYFPEDVMLTQEIWAPEPVVEAMIVHPGDSIHVDLDYKNITVVKFTGDAAQINTDLYTYNNESYSKPDMPDRDHMPKNEQEVRQLCKYIRADLLGKQKDFIDKVVPDDEVKTWTLHDAELKSYLILNGMLNNLHNEDQGMIVANKTVEFGKDLDDIYDTKLLNGRGYMLLGQLIPNNNRDLATPEQRLQTKLAQIEKSQYNALTKQMLVAYQFRSALASNNVAVVEKNRSVIDAKITELFIKQPLLQCYKEVKQNLADPSVATNNTYRPGASLLDSVIQQNKSKVIYVDIWATWCGPCRAEMPNSEKLKLQYKGKNVAFAAICIGNTKADWKSLLASLKLSPGQYYCDGAVGQQTILTPLHIRAFPHYMLVNREGRIISNGDALRPADPLTAKTIDKLLN